MTSILSIPTVNDLSKDFQGFITTGDKYIDDALGGGIFPGTITEFVGGRFVLSGQKILIV